jgi:hypothetical protein
MIEVVNKTTFELDPEFTEHPTKEFYIGRGSFLGNPYTSKSLEDTKALYQCESKEEALTKYKEYLLQKIDEQDSDICNMLDDIEKASNYGIAYLKCYCKPKKCHGDIIKEVIESRNKKRTISLF